ncbi:LexA family transcriptional regulator [uncultured Megasphaera sp.]|uniref:LexA family protein n=1 Tax=uncultured Megasphaera sp. TaxID=165188 RepID=UPI002596AAFB|nr:XRE family transcriptional regulator [uncultured Megasphaera sp.]
MNKLKNIGERIKQARLKIGFSQEELASKVGFASRSSVSKIEKGDQDIPRLKLIEIAKALNISASQLLDTEEVIPTTNIDSHMHYFLDASISAGYPLTVDSVSNLPTVSIPDIFLGKYAKNKHILIMRVNGDSMNKIIPNGSYIAVKTNIDVLSISNGDIVVANVEGADNGYTIKHIYKDDTNNRVILRPNSTNPIHTDIIISSAESQRLYIVGKVVAYNVLL